VNNGDMKSLCAAVFLSFMVLVSLPARAAVLMVETLKLFPSLSGTDNIQALKESQLNEFTGLETALQVMNNMQLNTQRSFATSANYVFHSTLSDNFIHSLTCPQMLKELTDFESGKTAQTPKISRARYEQFCVKDPLLFDSDATLRAAAEQASTMSGDKTLDPNQSTNWLKLLGKFDDATSALGAGAGGSFGADGMSSLVAGIHGGADADGSLDATSPSLAGLFDSMRSGGSSATAYVDESKITGVEGFAGANQPMSLNTLAGLGANEDRSPTNIGLLTLDGALRPRSLDNSSATGAGLGTTHATQSAAPNRALVGNLPRPDPVSPPASTREPANIARPVHVDKPTVPSIPEVDTAATTPKPSPVVPPVNNPTTTSGDRVQDIFANLGAGEQNTTHTNTNQNQRTNSGDTTTPASNAPNPLIRMMANSTNDRPSDSSATVVPSLADPVIQATAPSATPAVQSGPVGGNFSVSPIALIELAGEYMKCGGENDGNKASDDELIFLKDKLDVLKDVFTSKDFQEDCAGEIVQPVNKTSGSCHLNPRRVSVASSHSEEIHGRKLRCIAFDSAAARFACSKEVGSKSEDFNKILFESRLRLAAASELRGSLFMARPDDMDIMYNAACGKASVTVDKDCDLVKNSDTWMMLVRAYGGLPMADQPKAQDSVVDIVVNGITVVKAMGCDLSKPLISVAEGVLEKTVDDADKQSSPTLASIAIARHLGGIRSDALNSSVIRGIKQTSAKTKEACDMCIDFHGVGIGQ
jgi:hypothetical protein